MNNAATPKAQFSLFEHTTDSAQGEDTAAITPEGKFSNFIAYEDESGDHGMGTLDPHYPVFVLAFCVFYKRHYAERVVPALEKFKFNRFGHDLVVLHETEIRKETGAFRFRNRQHREGFFEELTEIIDASNFILISCVIDKLRLQQRGNAAPPNPYHVALGFCLETLHDLMLEKKQDGKLTHVVVERRGPKEDAELELEFRRVCDGANRKGISLPFDIIFADKRVNSSGLQLADLVARPIGLDTLRPDQPNRAFDVLRRKFFCRGGRQQVGQDFKNWGLKIYPPPDSEKPR